MIGDADDQFARFVERDHACEGGICNVKDSLVLYYRDGRSKTQVANLAPTPPFFLFAIEEAHSASARVGQAEIVSFIEAKAERFDECLVSLIGTRNQMPQPGEH